MKEHNGWMYRAVPGKNEWMAFKDKIKKHVVADTEAILKTTLDEIDGGKTRVPSKSSLYNQAIAPTQTPAALAAVLENLVNSVMNSQPVSVEAAFWAKSRDRIRKEFE